MGLMRWMRGGDENSAATAAISAGLAEIDGLFRPSKHKQTEHVEEAKRKKVDVANGAGIDLETGVARVQAKASSDGEAVPAASRPARERAVYRPRRRGLWYRMRLSMHRRRRSRAAADATGR